MDPEMVWCGEYRDSGVANPDHHANQNLLLRPACLLHYGPRNSLLIRKQAVVNIRNLPEKIDHRTWAPIWCALSHRNRNNLRLLFRGPKLRGLDHNGTHVILQ